MASWARARETKPRCTHKRKDKCYCTWVIRWYEDDREIQKSFPLGRTPAEMEAGTAAKNAFVAEVSLRLASGSPGYTGGSELFGSYAGQWIRQHHGKPNTKAKYFSTLRTHISPVLGDVPLNKITREMIVSLVKEKISGPSVRETALILISAVLKEAVMARRIPENPASNIRLPDGMPERARFVFASREELDVVASHSLPEEWRLALWLMRASGFRIGEALALREDSPRGDEIRAEEQVLGDRTLGPLKARKPGEYRDAPLPGYARKLIDAHVRKFGIPAGGYLFPAFATGAKCTDQWRYRFDLGRVAAGLPPEFTPHDLRHTFVSICLSRGIPITDVARWLGHKNINVTHAIYGHMVPGAPGRACGVLDDEFRELAGHKRR